MANIGSPDKSAMGDLPDKVSLSLKELNTNLMFDQSRAAFAAGLLTSRSWRRLTAFLFSICVIVLCSLPVSAQTRISGAQIRNPIIPVSVLPSTCRPYSAYFLTTTNTPYICTSTDTFTPLSAGAASGLPSQTGLTGYLTTNGTTDSWSNIVTGGSGALDCATVPGQCDVTQIVPLMDKANTWTGANDFHSALLRIPESTVAGLPAASSNTGREFMLTDGASGCDTSTGGGSTRVLVVSNGTSYVAPNCSTGGGTGSTAWGGIIGTLSNQSDLMNALALKAPLANPAFTGTTTLVNATCTGTCTGFGGGNTGSTGSTGSTAWGGITGTMSNQSDLMNALALKAPLASPAFTGTTTLVNATCTGTCTGFGGSGGGGGMSVYDQNGNAVTGAHIVTFVMGAAGYANDWSYTLTGPAAFTSAPNCVMSTNNGPYSGNTATYCVAAGATICAHNSTGTTLWFHGTFSPGIDTATVSCIGN